MIKKSKFPYLLFLLLLTAISCQSPAEQQEPAAEEDLNEKLTSWLDEKYEESLQKSPLTLTTLGRKDHYGALDDLSLKALKEEAE
ncbi:MAG: hypothetical protein ACI9XJ_001962, partial [Marivirga sp.]